MLKLNLRLIQVLIAVLLCAGCSKSRNKSELVWRTSLPGIGSQSSPRAADLNKDGVSDIVMGAGRNEYQHSAQGILALDGRTGLLLWQQEAADQVYGSATFYDVTGDEVPDVFIGGRSPHFRALDGTTGRILWEYNYAHTQDPVMRHARFNFHNAVLVPDQNNDGYRDLLTVNSGNSKAAPGDETDRFPGVLILFDSRTGGIIAADTMPDGRESYMSPLAYAQPGSDTWSIIFGTGGETLSGNLYKASLADLLERNLARAAVIAAESGHGFVAPPVLADISGDGQYDVIAISHASSVFAIDGNDHHLLWSRKILETESSNSFAVGQFTGDETPDFFTFVSKGEWPNSTGSVQVMFDGSDGRIAFMDSIGCTGYSSPVVVDSNGDGWDDAILSVNEYDCSVGFSGTSPPVMENRLILIDFRKNTVQTIDQTKGVKNIFSTPWIGDLDSDGYLDVVHCQYFHHGNMLNFLGMDVKCIATPIRLKKPPRWGAYMGTNGDGIFK